MAGFADRRLTAWLSVQDWLQEQDSNLHALTGNGLTVRRVYQFAPPWNRSTRPRTPADATP